MYLSPGEELIEGIQPRGCPVNLLPMTSTALLQCVLRLVCCQRNCGFAPRLLQICVLPGAGATVCVGYVNITLRSQISLSASMASHTQKVSL